MHRNLITGVMSLFFLGSLFVPNGRADEWDKTTIFTFNEPIQVPGKVLLAGTYVFKLLDTAGDRNIVQIFNADRTRLITTIVPIPDYRGNVSEKGVLNFEKQRSGRPEALKEWFYPGDDYGLEFVYPKESDGIGADQHTPAKVKADQPATVRGESSLHEIPTDELN
jgi:hypothetical protein